MNLHALARGLVSLVQKEETVELVRCTGQDMVGGKAVPRYAPPVAVRARVQSEKEDMQQFKDETLSTVWTRKFYFDGTPADFPRGIDRPGGKGGDMIRTGDGTWWLVTAVLEDFSGAGWVSVRGTRQTEGPHA
ncbi:MAG: hypothetical protein LBR80_03670 [Deltaproteobacteria bacterium]|jgi:hypothetical protein|nr:hypothetical protein [Deltaproteobacteria bacterium]